MSRAWARKRCTALVVGATCAAATASVGSVAAAPAYGFNIFKPICGAAGMVSGLAGKACSVVQHGGRLLSAGKKLLTGHLGGAVKDALGEGAGAAATAATAAVGLTALVTWVVVGARYALKETADVLGHTTAPQLETTWFSSTYWRVAAIAAVLTLPFLFFAAIQAILQSDLILLLRGVAYLPLAMLAVGIAAPLTMLLLAASDQMSAIVSSAAGHASTHFLNLAGASIGGLSLLSRSPFLVFFAALLTVAGAVVLWLELLVREAAVYVIVLMLPLAFAALVWPARRIWAIRAVELLVALVLSKFAIVAVLSLGGAALGQGAQHSITGLLAGFVLLVMGSFAPWALLRLLPLTELASGAAGSLRAESAVARRWLEPSDAGARRSHDLASGAPIRSDADAPAGSADSNEAARAAVDGLAANSTRHSGTPLAGEASAPTESPGPADASAPAAPPSTAGVASSGGAPSVTAATPLGAASEHTVTGPSEPGEYPSGVRPAWEGDDLENAIDLDPRPVPPPPDPGDERS